MQETAILALKNLIFTSALLLAAAVSCTDISEADSERIKDVLSDSLFSISYSWNVDMDFIEDGERRLNLKSSQAKSYTVDRNKYTALSGPVEITVFKNDSTDTMVFADSAFYKPAGSVFELYGNVEVISLAGRHLSSQYLKWERMKDQVSTDIELTIVTPVDSINAKGFVGNTDLTDYTLTEVTGKTVIH